MQRPAAGGRERRGARRAGAPGLGSGRRGRGLGRGRRWGRGGRKQARRGAAETGEGRRRGPAAGGGSVRGRPRGGGGGPITVPGSGRRPEEVRLGGGAGRPVRAPSLDSTDLLHIGFSPPPAGGGSRAEAMTSSQRPEVVECKKLPTCDRKKNERARRKKGEKNFVPSTEHAWLSPSLPSGSRPRGSAEPSCLHRVLVTPDPPPAALRVLRCPGGGRRREPGTRTHLAPVQRPPSSQTPGLKPGGWGGGERVETERSG